jgi:hypothetical protein
VLEDDDVEREYRLLLRDAHLQLQPEEQQRLIRRIQQGPDTAAWQERFAANAGHEPADDRIAYITGTWVRDRLAPLAPVLDDAASARLDQLTVEYGPTSDLTVIPQRVFGSWTAESVIDAAELQAMPSPELVKFLNSWQPPDDWRGLDRTSIRKALSAAVLADAEQRSADAAIFVGLDHPFIESIVNGLAVAAQAGRQLDWAALIWLFQWTNDQAAAELAAGVVTRAERRWRAARHSALRLLGIAFCIDPSPVPADTEPGLWELIQTAASDPDPDTGDTETAEHLDSVRPAALEAAVLLAHWKRRTDQQSPITNILQLLGEHTNPDIDGSGAIPGLLRCRIIAGHGGDQVV